MDLRWQHDNEVNSCYLCHVGFNLFNRRHHCRKCGKIVCGDCSSQPIKYFPRTMIVEKGQVMRSNPYEIYRTCDNCVEEIKMIRRAIFDDDDDSSVEVDHHDGGGGDNSSVTKYSSRMMTRTLNSSHSSSIRDDISDQNLCPICAINLSDIVKGWKGDFESFKEHHINECLINHDFNLNHQRYEGNHPKNKMLVYNIPPIPQPKFESIVGSLDTIQLDSTKSNGHTSSSTNSNINNNHHHDVGDGTSTRAIMGSPMNNGKFDESFGSLNSNNTNTTIIEYDECVVCLEDLKPGDKVGRLECLCVFHYKCIKDWFNKKGYGECPVHYLQK